MLRIIESFKLNKKTMDIMEIILFAIEHHHRYLEMHLTLSLTRLINAEALAFSCHSFGMSIPGIRPAPER